MVSDTWELTAHSGLKVHNVNIRCCHTIVSVFPKKHHIFEMGCVFNDNINRDFIPTMNIVLALTG